jgi:hypothetical protein
MTLVQAQTRRMNRKAVLLCKTLFNIVIPLLSTERQNGRKRAAWAFLPEETSSNSQMALCAVRRTIHSTRKNGELSIMARYVSCMQLALVTAVHVH